MSQLFATKLKPMPGFEHLAGQCFSGRASRALRRRLRTPETITLSQWAERYRRVTEIDSHPGPWRNEMMPHLVKIMDTVSLPYVREVYMCMPERAGKTQVLVNAAGKKVSDGSKSGNIFWLMPTEAEAKKAMINRIIPVFKAKNDHGKPGYLSRFLSKYDDDTKQGAIRFNTGVRLFPAWANSPASMAAYFGALNIGDEIDKFDKATKEGTDAITLIRKRGRDDKSRSQNIFASTPGARRQIFSLATEEAQQVWQHCLRCPECGELINPTDEHLDYPNGSTAADIELNGCELACPANGCILDEEQREQGYRSGAWVCIKGADIKRPETVGFHMSAYVLPRVPLAEIGAAFIRAENGGIVEKTAYANGYKVEDYDPPKATDNYKDVLALCDDRPRDMVPDNTACLILNVDSQMNGFYTEVAAVEYQVGEQSISSHLVHKGYVLTFADLEALVDRVWLDSTGKQYQICSALIDSGGGRKAGAPPKHSRTKEVYEFCKRNPMFAPLKGTGRKDTPVSTTKLERWPNSDKPIPGGLILIKLDVHYYKDCLASAMSVPAGEPGSFNLYSGYTQQQIEHPVAGITPENGLTDYAKHLCAEFRNELGMWEHDKKAGRNDYHDIATYRMYHIERVRAWGLLVLPVTEFKPKSKLKNKQQSSRGW